MDQWGGFTITLDGKTLVTSGSKPCIPTAKAMRADGLRRAQRNIEGDLFIEE